MNINQGEQPAHGIMTQIHKFQNLQNNLQFLPHQNQPTVNRHQFGTNYHQLDIKHLMSSGEVPTPTKWKLDAKKDHGVVA